MTKKDLYDFTKSLKGLDDKEGLITIWMSQLSTEKELHITESLFKSIFSDDEMGMLIERNSPDYYKVSVSMNGTRVFCLMDNDAFREFTGGVS